MSREYNSFNRANDYKWPNGIASPDTKILQIHRSLLVNVLQNAIDIQNWLMELSQSDISTGEDILQMITKSGYIVGALKYHVGDT